MVEGCVCGGGESPSGGTSVVCEMWMQKREERGERERTGETERGKRERESERDRE